MNEWNTDVVKMMDLYPHGCAQVTQGPEKAVLAVLTDRDLLLYPSLPESTESLNSPTKSHPLITTRFSQTARGFSGTCNTHVSLFFRVTLLRPPNEQICVNRPFSGLFLFGTSNKNTLTLSITGLLDSLENKSETRIWVMFSLPSISPEHSTCNKQYYPFSYPNPSRLLLD